MVKNAKVNVQHLSDELLTVLYSDALLSSYEHTCQIFSPDKHYNRDKTDKSFLEITHSVLKDKSFRHITVLFRDIVNENYDIEHWEFGMTSNQYCLNIKVNVELAINLFDLYELKIVNY